MAVDKAQHQSKWIEFFVSDRYRPIREVLSLYLTIADVLALSRVCRILSQCKVDVWRNLSNINAHLRNFVNDPAIFRSELGRHDGLISGPFALNIFELGLAEVLYLDIFIKDGADADQFTTYMLESEKYQKVRVDVESPPNCCVYVSSIRPQKKLRITRTSGPPIRTILTSSYTTACVNVITWNKAFSIFPRSTIIDHQFYPLRSLDNNFGSHLNELACQGWTTRDIAWVDLTGAKTGRVSGLRRVGDEFTLVIPLNVDCVQAANMPDFVIEHAQFEISEDRIAQPNGLFLRISAQELTLPGALHSYTTGCLSWRFYVDTRLKRWAWLELYKAGIGDNFARATSVFSLVSEVSISQVPQSWDYADDQIPRWYQEWEQKERGRGF